LIEPCDVALAARGGSDSLSALYIELLGWRAQDCSGAYRHLDNEPNGERRCLESGCGGVWSDAPVNFKVLSPLATAPWYELVSEKVPDGRVEIETEGGRCATVAIHRTIAPDDKLIAALLEELRLRGIDPSKRHGYAGTLGAALSRLQPRLQDADRGGARYDSRDHVVLVAEWDTKFGRTLPRLFAQQVVCPRVCTPSSDGPCEEK
jgi:hypothetical protein